MRAHNRKHPTLSSPIFGGPFDEHDDLGARLLGLHAHAARRLGRHLHELAAALERVRSERRRARILRALELNECSFSGRVEYRHAHLSSALEREDEVWNT
jgi:hypothetical protein